MYTPELWPIIVAISSPLPLAVTIWLITATHAKEVEIHMNISRVRLGMVAEAETSRIVRSR
jgi:hypothetical protein